MVNSATIWHQIFVHLTRAPPRVEQYPGIQMIISNYRYTMPRTWGRWRMGSSRRGSGGSSSTGPSKSFRRYILYLTIFFKYLVRFCLTSRFCRKLSKAKNFAYQFWKENMHVPTVIFLYNCLRWSHFLGCGSPFIIFWGGIRIQLFFSKRIRIHL